MAKQITRGIDQEFANAFRSSELYGLYKKYENELYIGVRNKYLNLYYYCASVAKVEFKKGCIKCMIAKKYLDGTGIASHINIDPGVICDNYAKIKENIEKRSTPEKNAQSKLILLNNANSKSNWFCVDIEWAKAFESRQQKSKVDFFARFDIVAISKSKPHEVALIELKYGRQAIGGRSGIYQHIENFYKYQSNGYFDAKNNSHKYEIANIVNSYKLLGIKVPEKLQNLQSDWNDSGQNVKFGFYVITLDNNSLTPRHSTPKQSMAAYLFKSKRWCCNKLSSGPNVEKKYGDVTSLRNKLQVNFLFSSQTLGNLKINDVIDGDYDDREFPK